MERVPHHYISMRVCSYVCFSSVLTHHFRTQTWCLRRYLTHKSLQEGCQGPSQRLGLLAGTAKCGYGTGQRGGPEARPSKQGSVFGAKDPSCRTTGCKHVVKTTDLQFETCLKVMPA